MKIQTRPLTNVDAPATGGTDAARRASAYGRSGATAPAAGPPAGTTPEDRVTISEEGRARLAADAARADATQAGREALDALPEMSEARAAELRARVENGYYSQPEQTRAVAERLADELRGKAPGA